MSEEIFQSKEYREIMKKCLSDTISLLFDKNEHFSILCTVEDIEFNPILPSDIYNQFGSEVIFSLAGYTYESASVNDKYLSFEAGFGSEGFGSVLNIPLLNIKHLLIDNIPLIINHSPLITEEDDDSKEQQENNSMQALMNNPENQKLASFRKARKK
jgi:hypothetical protein